MSELFDGDGRRMLKPVQGGVLENTLPESIRRKYARQLIAGFTELGYQRFVSPAAHSWVIVWHCIEEKIPYRVKKTADGVEIVNTAFKKPRSPKK
jgi:hypothetical protein